MVLKDFLLGMLSSPAPFLWSSLAGIDKQRLWGSKALASLLLVHSTSSNCNPASDTRFTNQYRWRSLRT